MSYFLFPCLYLTFLCYVNSHMWRFCSSTPAQSLSVSLVATCPRDLLCWAFFVYANIVYLKKIITCQQQKIKRFHKEIFIDISKMFIISNMKNKFGRTGPSFLLNNEWQGRVTTLPIRWDLRSATQLLRLPIDAPWRYFGFGSRLL